MRLLFSFLTVGTASLPAWRMTQPARDASNSSVKKRGKGVGVNSKVGVGCGVLVTGTGVCEAGSVAVGKREVAGVGVAATDWQAASRIRHPRIRSFFMAPIKT